MTTAVAERQDNAPATVAQHPTGADMLAMIERMAVNPNIDPDKLERLIAMKKDIDATSARLAFNSALAKMTGELPAIEKKGASNNGAYGKWEDIQDAILPVLSRHGFALSFKTASDADSITVTAILHHEAGHDDSTDLRLPADKSGSKNNVQAVGSSVSYGKRYTASALLNLRIGGEDDDGRDGGGGFINDEQFAALEQLMSDVKADKAKFLAYFKIDGLGNLPAKDFDRAQKLLETKRAK